MHLCQFFKKALMSTLGVFTVFTSTYLFAQSPCPLIFDSNCTISTLKTALANNSLDEIDLFDQAYIVQLGTELSLPKAFQQKAWPYHYRDNRVSLIKSALNQAAISQIYKQVNDHSTVLKQEIQAGHNYSFTFKECMSVNKDWYRPFIKAAYCNSRQLRRPRDINTILKYIKTLKEDEQLALYKFMYKDLLEHGELNKAADVAAQLIYVTAVEPEPVKQSARLYLISTQLGLGLDKLATQEIAAYIPDTNSILPTLQKLDFYHKWAAAISDISAQNLAQFDDNINSAFSLIELQSHIQLLAEISTLSAAEQAKTHRLFAQSLFYSYFSANTAIDTLLGFHMQKWQEIYEGLSPQEQVEEGLKMMLFELKAASFFDHHARKIKYFIKKNA